MLNFFELTLQLNGYPIKDAKKHLKKIQGIPEDQYLAYTIEQRKGIVDFHIESNPFYKSFLGEKSVEKWEDIPIMMKRDLQIHLVKRLSKGYTLKDCYTSKTSGSSGQPLIFAKDKYCHALTWAEIIDRFGWFSINFNSSYQARFYGIPLDFKNYQKERLKDYLSHRFRFPIFDLSESKLEEFLNEFKKKKFYFINGHTSSIVLFAKYLKKKNVQLTSVCPTLKYCVVTSEMLYDQDKKLLESIFGIPIINEYGASELDLIAFTNNEDELIVNSETLFVEIMDENNKVLPNGEAGRIIVTSLFNKAQPIIRYDIGDLGVLDPKSTFKKPILQKLIGRANDFAQLPSGKTVPGHTFYYITKSIVEDDGNVKEFIIEQTNLDAFKIIYVSEKELNPDEITKVKIALVNYVEDNLKLTFERVDMLQRKRSGKLKQFTSLIKK